MCVCGGGGGGGEGEALSCTSFINTNQCDNIRKVGILHTVQTVRASDWVIVLL